MTNVVTVPGLGGLESRINSGLQTLGGGAGLGTSQALASRHLSTPMFSCCCGDQLWFPAASSWGAGAWRREGACAGLQPGAEGGWFLAHSVAGLSEAPWFLRDRALKCPWQ